MQIYNIKIFFFQLFFFLRALLRLFMQRNQLIQSTMLAATVNDVLIVLHLGKSLASSRFVSRYYRFEFPALFVSIGLNYFNHFQIVGLGIFIDHLDRYKMHSYEILKNALLKKLEVILFIFNKSEKKSCQIALSDGNVHACHFIK